MKTLPGRSGKRQADRRRLLNLALRGGIWLAAGVAALGLLWALGFGVRRLFYQANPHFTLRSIEVDMRGGAMPRETVLRQLRAKGVREGESNLYALDLAALRRDLELDPLIQYAELRRRLPDTIVLRVYGRAPVAQLLEVGGRLIDEHAVIMPADHKTRTLALPVIIPISGLAAYETGERLDRPTVQQALAMLKHKSSIARGACIEPRIIQLGETEGDLRLYVRGNEELRLVDNAEIILPANNVRAGLARALAVLEERAAAGQATRKINATYEKVPVER